MEAARQMKINTYATELSHIAYTTIHNEELLQDVNTGIELYKNCTITKVQLNRVYKTALKQTKLEIKIKQKQIEAAYHLEVLKRLYNTVEYIPIVESNKVYKFNDDSDVIIYLYSKDNELITYPGIEHYKILLYPKPENMEGVKYDPKYGMYIKYDYERYFEYKNLQERCRQQDENRIKNFIKQNILSFLRFNGTNCEYKSGFVIKYVELKYLGVWGF